MANPLDFLQLTPENIAQARGMPWKQAFSQDFNPLNPNYRGFSTAYQGADRTGLGKYVTGGLRSIVGKFDQGSNIGGATPLTRKLALGAGDILSRVPGYAMKGLGYAASLPFQSALMTLSPTAANASEVDMTAEDFERLRESAEIDRLKNLITPRSMWDDPRITGWTERRGVTVNPLMGMYLGSKGEPLKIPTDIRRIKRHRDQRATQKGIAQVAIQKRIQEEERQRAAAAAAQAAAAQQVRQNIQTYGNRDRPNVGINRPGGGRGQSPTGGDVAGTPFYRGGLASLYG